MLTISTKLTHCLKLIPQSKVNSDQFYKDNLVIELKPLRLKIILIEFDEQKL